MLEPCFPTFVGLGKPGCDGTREPFAGSRRDPRWDTCGTGVLAGLFGGHPGTSVGHGGTELKCSSGLNYDIVGVTQNDSSHYASYPLMRRADWGDDLDSMPRFLSRCPPLTPGACWLRRARMRERGSLRAGVVGRKGTPRALPSSRLSEQRPLPPLGFLLSCGSFTGVLSEGHERPCLDALVAGRCLQRSLAPLGTALRPWHYSSAP